MTFMIYHLSFLSVAKLQNLALCVQSLLNYMQSLLISQLTQVCSKSEEITLLQAEFFHFIST